MLITERRRARAHGCGRRLWEMAEVRPGSVQTRCSCTPRGTRVRRVCADSPAITRARHFARYASSAGRCSLRAKASIANDDLSRRITTWSRVMSIIPERTIERRDCTRRRHSPRCRCCHCDVTIIALSRSLLCACARGRDIIASYIISVFALSTESFTPLLLDDIVRYFVNYFVNWTSERPISCFSLVPSLLFLPADRFSYLFVFSSNETHDSLSKLI